MEYYVLVFRNSLGGYQSAKEKNAKFTFSAGIVVDDKSLDLDEILATADEKLLQAKRAGKNQVVV